jgi:pectin methylesterase-like acyl-CoA thioesterase
MACWWYATSSTLDVVKLDPGTDSRAVCVDTPLRLRFDRAQRLGTAGVISIRRADGSLADRIDLADASTHVRTVGDAVDDAGEPHLFRYFPVIVEGETVTIYPHRPLAYGQTYYVTIDPGVLAGFQGIGDDRTWRFTTRAAPPPPGTRTLRVAVEGTADFRTVQGAIDFVSKGNSRPVTIDVEPGTYTELTYVRADRPGITVRGRDRERTVIQYANNNVLNGHASNSHCPCRRLDVPDLHNCWRASFGVEADDFTLRNLTLHNTTPDGGSQAEAFRGNGERTILDRVTLRSFQDTLRLQGSGFVTGSTIEGDTDFVWGVGAVFVRDSELRSVGSGYYCQIRNDAQHHGNVFVNCRLTRSPETPDTSVYLARIAPEVFPHSQAVFVGTAMDRHVHPAGWLIQSDDTTPAPDVRFWEYGSTDLEGRPIDTSARHPASRQLTADEAARWSDPAFVLGGWEPACAT